ncbi:MAG TPA: 7TM diverse intracellular signaling domain-containing protein [Pseudomonadales bacterium]|nr:7TM diverse intracellular signaling domain-containing protein [Pseudomonadales bacterium]
MSVLVMLLLLAARVGIAEEMQISIPTELNLAADAEIFQADESLQFLSEDINAFKQSLTPISKIDKKGGSFWLHFKIRNTSEETAWTFAHFGSYIENIEIYVLRESEVQHAQSGQFHADDYPLHNGANVNLKPYQSYEVWAQFKSRYFTGNPTLYLIPQHQFEREVYIDNLLIIGCLGAIFILAAYNLLLYFWIRTPDYLYYSIYLIITFIGWSAVFKIFVQALGVSHSSIIFVAFNANIVANTLFYFHFLDLKSQHPRLVQIGATIAACAAVVTFINPWLPCWVNYMLINILSGAWLTMGLIAGIACWSKGYKPARFFIAGFISLVISGSIVIFLYFDIARVTQKEYLTTLVFQAVDAIFLGIALADRINTLRKEKASALQYALETDQKANAVLLQANKKLHDALQLSEENQRKKDEFIMAVSHELRTPLNAISASLDQLKFATDEYEKRGLHQFIQFGTDRLSSQIENLIMLAETDHVEVKAAPRLFFIDSLIDKMRHTVASYIFNKPVEFDVVRSGEAIDSYRGDDYLLLRLITPILENACKYTPKGYITLAIDTQLDHIMIRICDSGPGVAPEIQSKIFESFTQASIGYQRSHEGLGIGLTVAQRIARILGTRIQIESELGKGSCFFFRVPMEAQSQKHITLENALEGHVLVAEDNEVNAKVLIALLKKMGLTAELAINGKIAIAATERGRYDAILMDLQMPEMDGFTATRIMRKQGVRCPIIAVTANSDYQARMRCWEVGMNDLLTKPMNKDDLNSKLAYWMHKQTAI